MKATTIGCLAVGALLVAAGLGGCAVEPAGSSAAGSAAGSETAPPPAASALSAEDQAAGWVLLFDGETLDGWRGYRMEAIPAGWRVDDSAIHFVPPAEEAQEAVERADLLSEESFGDFELRFAWAVSSGGNSGVFFRVSEDREETYHTGPEYQLLDNAGHRDGQSPLTSAGSNYALHAPARDVTRPVGEFNQARIVVDGAHVEHWMNGEKLLEYTLWDDDWKARVAGSKFAIMPGYGLNEVGHIALQDHGDEVWFRDLAIRRLGETSP